MSPFTMWASATHESCARPYPCHRTKNSVWPSTNPRNDVIDEGEVAAQRHVLAVGLLRHVAPIVIGVAVERAPPGLLAELL